jgi:parallel beta-helix repeat protein
VLNLPGTWPTEYPFPVLIDWGTSAQEAILVTSAPTGTGPYTLPCTRGIDGTTQQAHNAGAQVEHGTTGYEPALIQANTAAIAALESGTSGTVQLAGDLGGTTAVPAVVSTHLTAALPVNQGGTGTETGAPQNEIFAGPGSGGTGAPSFRGLVSADIPANAASTSGTAAGLSSTLATGSGGTGVAVPAPSNDTSGATDYAALSALISAAPAGSAITLNASAPYYIDTALTVSKSLAFYGSATIIQVTSNTAGVLVTAGGFTWDGPALTGPQYAAYHASESAIKVTGASSSSYISFIRIRHAAISSWGAYGVYAQYANDVVVADNDIYDIQYAGCVYLSVATGQIADNRVNNITGSSSNSTDCYGISLSEAILGVGSIDPVCENIAITGNTVTNVAIWTGIDMHAGTNVTIANNIVQGCNLAIQVGAQHDTASTPVTGPHRVKITGNVADIGALGAGQGTYGIVVSGAIVTTGSPTDPATGCSVTGNEVTGYGQPYESTVTEGGITAFATQSLVITGNTVHGCGPAGICLYHDNDGFTIGANTVTDAWDTLGHAGAVWLPSGYSTGTIGPVLTCTTGTVQAQAVLASASVGLNVSSVTTLTLQGTLRNTSPTSVFAGSGTVTVPTSAGTAVLAYTGTTSTTLTGVTLSSGSGTISAGFAGQAPAHVNVYGIFNDASTNRVTYYRGSSAAATEIDDAYGVVTVPYAAKGTSADAVIYLSSDAYASDTGDGLSWGSAKATLAGAISALGGSPGMITAGAGTFAFTTINWAQGISITGQGEDVTKFHSTITSGSAFANPSPGTLITFGHLEGFELYGADSGNATIGLDLNSRSAATVKDVLVTDFGTGVSLTSTTDGGCVYNRFQNVDSIGNGTGWQIGGEGSNSNTLMGCRGSGGTTGVAIADSNQNQFLGCQFESNTTGVAMTSTGGSGGNSTGNVIDGCRFEANATGWTTDADSNYNYIIGPLYVDSSVANYTDTSGTTCQVIDPGYGVIVPSYMYVNGAPPRNTALPLQQGQFSVTTESAAGTVGFTAYQNDGTDNRRIAVWLSSDVSWGLGLAYSSGGGIPFRLYNGSESLNPITCNAAQTVFGGGVADLIATQTLASNGAVTINANNGNVQAVTLEANATSSSITNPVTGQELTIQWIQDATGSRTYAWPTACKFAGASAPSATATANYTDSVTFIYNGTYWVEKCRATGINT